MTGRSPEGESPASRLARSVADRWRRRGWGGPGTRIVVACSGGLDSLVLLHLFRFALDELAVDVEAAHFDHGMRPESGEDAEWLRELTERWGVRLHVARAEEPPTDEGTARTLRYRFLEGLIASGETDRVLTAHHGDDQVETVLFRIVRGTGIAGLEGIPEEREPGILRPLLASSRAELEAYAVEHGIEPREDPTNASSLFARNRLRNEVLPLLDEVHPGARAGLLRLSRNARDLRAALDALLEPRLAAILRPSTRDPNAAETEVTWDRGQFLAEPESVQQALLRRLFADLGIRLSRTGTAGALQFMREGGSGAELTVQGVLRITRDFGEFRIGAPSQAPDAEDAPASSDMEARLAIPSGDSGRGSFRIGGIALEARWGESAEAESGDWLEAEFDARSLQFPLMVRAWHAGDRTRTTGGGKKLKKLFGERRIPREKRSRIPVLVDASGIVLWIPGVHRVPEEGPGGMKETGRRFVLRVRDAGRI